MPKAFTEEEAKNRVLGVAEFIIDNQATHEQAAEHFGLNKSYISQLMRNKLPLIDPEIAKEVEKIKNCHNIDKGGKKVNTWHVGVTASDINPPKKVETDFDSLPNFVPAAPPKQIREGKGLTDTTLEALAELNAYITMLADKMRLGSALTKEEATFVLETTYAHLHEYKLLGLRYEEK